MNNKCVLCDTNASHTDHLNDLNVTVNCPVCGEYDIEKILVALPADIQNRDDKYILSALTRQASESGSPLTITQANWEGLIGSGATPSPLEKMNRTLLYLNRIQYRPDRFQAIAFDKDYPLVFARDKAEFEYLVTTLEKQELVEEEVKACEIHTGQYRLTPQGWSRVEELRRTQPDSNQAFVAMWFTDELREAWEQGFRPALEATAFNPIRVDIIEHNQKIDDLIVAEIRRSGLLVADFTGNRGGVYFEAGFAMGLGIPVIWTCRNTDVYDLHFDTRQYNHIAWANPADLRKQLISRIGATMPGHLPRPD